ncbi:MAG: signal peptidase I [Chromatiales bacterium]|jgi:signal peptidase I
MNLDFPTILVLATFITGGIWLVDALVFAPKRRQLATEAGAEGEGGTPSSEVKEPVLVEYARSFFPVILVVLLLRSFVVEPFRIPSGSMMPTLLVGDFILVNKFAYGLRLPVLNTEFLELGSPHRGDVVVFRYPQDESIDYIKRVVGIPGDRIDYESKTLFVNGEPAPQTPVGIYFGSGAGARETGSLEGRERLGGETHEVLIKPQVPDFAPGCRVLADGPVTVPEGHYFVMGDNRDNSNDSRCWGMVPESNLVGKAFAIWMSYDGDRNGFPPIAWERIGDRIH